MEVALTDSDLITKSLKGDSHAFETLVHKYASAVYSIAYWHLKDFHKAQDIVQEVFIKAYQKLGELENADKVGGWLRTITRRACIDLIRNEKIHTAPLDPGLVLAASDATSEIPHDNLELWQTLNTLPANNRLAILLFYVGGYTTNEVAQILGITPEAVESRLRRAKKVLKRELLDTVEDALKKNRLDDAWKKQIAALVNKVIAAVSVGKHSDALKAAREAAAMDPADPFLKRVLADSLRSYGQMTDDRSYIFEAETLYLDLVKKDPADYHALGYLYLSLENYDKAVECFKKLPEHMPDPVIPMATVLYRKGDYDSSAREFERKTAEALADVCVGFRGMAKAVGKLGDVSLAQAYCRTLIGILKPLAPEPHFLTQLWLAYAELAALQAEDGMTGDSLASLYEAYAAAKLNTVCPICHTRLFARVEYMGWRSDDKTDLEWFLDTLISGEQFGTLKNNKSFNELIQQAAIEIEEIKRGRDN